MITRTLNKKELEIMFGYLEKRFGFDRNIWNDFEFLMGSKNRVFIVSKKVGEIISEFRSVTQGFIFARLDKVTKPSSNMIQVWGCLAKKNVLDLDEKQAKEYIEGLDLKIQSRLGNGYVILKHKYALGCGLLKDGNLKNMLPKGKRMNVELP